MEKVIKILIESATGEVLIIIHTISNYINTKKAFLLLNISEAYK